MNISHGVDIIEVSRIRQAIERWEDAFLKHIYTADEIAYAQKYKFPYPHFAGRFAAKEAIFKAVGDPHLSWQDVSISNDAEGKPICHFRKPIEFKVSLSISHTKEYAVASCIISSS